MAVTARSPDPEHTKDKLGLFILAGLVVLVLAIIVAGVYWTKGVPEKGDVLLGGISTGLILFLRDLVAAVRQSWDEVTRGKTTEALAAAGPASDSDHPQKVTIEQPANDPVPVSEKKR